MPDRPIDAILPAGGLIDPDFAAAAGTDVKAMIRLGEETFLARVLSAISNSGRIRRSVVIGGEAVREEALAHGATAVLPEGASGPDNIYRGLDFLNKQDSPPSKVLVCTTDLPFLCSGHVEWLLDASPADKDIIVPLVKREAFENAYPGTPSTFVKLKADEYTLGGMFLLDTEALKRSRSHIEAVFENRKSKFGMARLLGPSFVFRFLTKSLTLADVEAKIVSLIGCTGAALPGAPVELAYDVDDVNDYQDAVKMIASA